MKKNITKLILASLLISPTFFCIADDGEIFFNDKLSPAKPNVIFLLDVSGSMAWEPSTDRDNYSARVGKDSRIVILQDSLRQILSDTSITGVRAGISTFSYSTSQIQDVVDIDAINNNLPISIEKGTSTSTITHPVLYPGDDGYEITSGTFTSNLGYSNGSYGSSNTVAFRFSNNLIKNPSSVGASASSAIKRATLKIKTPYLYNGNTINIYIDKADSAPYLTQQWQFISNRQKNESDLVGKCTPASGYYSCDVTDVIKNKISKPGWEDGNAITFYAIPQSLATLTLYEQTVNERPKLIIEANNELVADNKSPYRNHLIQLAYPLTAYGGTSTVEALYDVARYVSNVPNKSNPGPSHNNTLSSSNPLLEGCQLTHIILMSDGQPSGGDYGSQVASYTGDGYGRNDCKVITGVDQNGKYLTKLDSSFGFKNQNEACGRSLTSWMARKDQSGTIFSGANYIRTNTIGFALKRQDKTQDANGLAAQNFLNDLATYGQGKAYEAVDNESLTAAFKEIISDVRAADSPSASGTVTLSPQSRYKQRKEVFYSLYASDAYNYWPGNMKRFQIEYVETTLTDNSKGTRAVLVDKENKSAMSPAGSFYNSVSSFWANSVKDGGRVLDGGVVGMLDPATRKPFTIKESKTIELQADAALTNTDLGLTGADQDGVRKGLIDFIHGYTYLIGGSSTPATQKIGDAARGSITLANYGCNDLSIENDIVKCNTLEQVALLASNDGFIRGYDVNTGKARFEFIPEEMLPLIQKLQIRNVVSFKKPRFYGLDGKAIIYHDDKNNDGYINGETAYAYISAGRGGKYIYALNISTNTSQPKLEWTITNKTTGFEKLGYTWSTPSLGKIKLGGKIIPVLVFGGGYDKSSIEEDTPEKRTSAIGNAIYIVDAVSGSLIWTTSANMAYSIPSPVTLVKDDSSDDKLITDIIFGDMGGQVWRFHINNNATAVNGLVSPVGAGGIIAKLAGSSVSSARKFYQAPAVYQFKDSGVQKLSVSIGSGYRNHPLSLAIKDKIYSLRVTKDPSGNQPVLTESDLATIAADGQSIQSGTLDNGFMINLTGEGEKVITDGFSDFDRLVFNTFIPSNTDVKTCVPSVGTQRTYNYNIRTGISLLKDPFISIGISALPPDVTLYCDSSYCTIISDPSQLSKEKELSKGKDGVDPFIVKTDASSNYIRTGWTDIFNISK